MHSEHSAVRGHNTVVCGLQHQGEHASLLLAAGLTGGNCELPIAVLHTPVASPTHNWTTVVTLPTLSSGAQNSPRCALVVPFNISLSHHCVWATQTIDDSFRAVNDRHQVSRCQFSPSTVPHRYFRLKAWKRSPPYGLLRTALAEMAI